jgi:hypothetical protein
MAQDLITGIWSTTNKPNIASWSTDDSLIKGFGVYNSKGTGKLYFDKNKNGIFDKKDKAIGSIKFTDQATDANNVGYGTFVADIQSKSGSFMNPSGIELAVASLTDLSYF